MQDSESPVKSAPLKTPELGEKKIVRKFNSWRLYDQVYIGTRGLRQRLFSIKKLR